MEANIPIYLVAPATYNVRNDVSVINVNTSSGGVTIINIPKITPSYPRSKLYINDVSNNASVGHIVVNATGGNLINNASSLVLNGDGISAEVEIADDNRFLVNLNTDAPTPPVTDKNYVHTQTIPLSSWLVNHNLDKKCSVSLADSVSKEIEAEVEWINNNQVMVRLNKDSTGFAFCN